MRDIIQNINGRENQRTEVIKIRLEGPISSIDRLPASVFDLVVNKNAKIGIKIVRIRSESL